MTAMDTISGLRKLSCWDRTGGSIRLPVVNFHYFVLNTRCHRLLQNVIVAYFNKWSVYSKFFEILKVLAINSMAIFLFSFLWKSTIWKSGTFCSRVARQRNQRTFTSLLSGLVKHETYWQMLKLDISFPDISFQFVSTFNDSGGFYFLKCTPNSFLKYDG